MSKDLLLKIAESKSYIESRVEFDFSKSTFIVLGSGFKAVADQLSVDHELELSSIPHVKAPAVAGHGTSLIFGKLSGKNVIVQSGRLHLYEGHEVSDVVFTVRLMNALGVETAIFTNASGSLKTEFKPGEIALISDHINFTGVSALTGTGSLLGPQFVDMIGCYNTEITQLISKKLRLKQGVYVGVLGPTYETAAETKMFALLGGDLVGMSTVQEVIAARQLGMNVAGLSLVTNYAAGIAESVNHSEVLKLGESSQEKAAECLKEILSLF